MQKVFRNRNGDVLNVKQHTLDILNECPNVKIHIGTDSQNFKRKTIYVSVIAYRMGNSGVHCIYHKIKEKKNKDKWSRLWKEAIMTMEIAEWLSEKINVNIEVDFDFNGDANHYSYRLISAAQGMATASGFKSNVKPYNQVATWAADMACK